jgi:hypothetical protein
VQIICTVYIILRRFRVPFQAPVNSIEENSGPKLHEADHRLDIYDIAIEYMSSSLFYSGLDLCYVAYLGRKDQQT